MCLLFLEDYRSISFLVLFFFKQKTAYEMRISDWSSDVCSSDLHVRRRDDAAIVEVAREHVFHQVFGPDLVGAGGQRLVGIVAAREHGDLDVLAGAGGERDDAADHLVGVTRRSEEHTSELQSLMRISYAVFCLKKKNNN